MDKKVAEAKFQIIRNGLTVEILHNLKKKHAKNLESLLEEKYKASKLGMSRRVLSHWRNLGLLDISDSSVDDFKLSMLGLFWLQVVIELRSFGMSLENIIKIKDSLFKNNDLPLLESYLLFSFMPQDIDFFIIASSDGKADVGSRREIEISESLGFLEKNYIKINFNILKNKFITEKVDVVKQKFTNNFLQDTEYSVIDLIRQGEYKSVELVSKDGIITKVSKKVLEQNPDPFRELRKLIKEGTGFSNINIKQANGKFVSIETDIMEKT